MNLHQAVAGLIKAQNEHDSVAYTANFANTAVVTDEGKTYRGKAAIQRWIEHADQQYQTVLKPVSYVQHGDEYQLKAEASGTFPGSPAVLTFHLCIQDDLITSLNITG